MFKKSVTTFDLSQQYFKNLIARLFKAFEGPERNPKKIYISQDIDINVSNGDLSSLVLNKSLAF